MQLKHTNGLTLALPDAAFRVRENSNGYLIEPPDAASTRNPPSIEIALRAGEPPPGDWPATKELGKAAARYRTEIVPGGSGGDEHVLTAWIPCPTGYVVIRHSQQVEPPAKPDFSLAWVMLGTAGCEPAQPRN
jgi:hypothetical protein